MSTTINPSITAHRSEAATVLRRIFDEGFATGDTAVVDELCSPDLVEHQFGLAGTGAAAVQHVKDAIRDVHAAFPDVSFTIEDTAENGDTIWVRVRGRGTATGPFFGPRAADPSTSPWWTSPASSTAASWSTGECRTDSPSWPRPASWTASGDRPAPPTRKPTDRRLPRSGSQRACRPTVRSTPPVAAGPSVRPTPQESRQIPRSDAAQRHATSPSYAPMRSAIIG